MHSLISSNRRQDSSDIEDALKQRKIAVVGLSSNLEKASYQVATFMMTQGYEIVPVNPGESKVLGKKSYSNLKDAYESEGPIKLVNVFRQPQHLIPVVLDSIEIGSEFLWFQLGVVNEEAISLAREAGIRCIVDKCLKIEFGKN
ncbi:MAG: CoA-binding protein [Gammaproteobacteria bacterium]|nr:CoA-binding protein [Gammaproteobacteria bacterium]|tara:strand:+ start:16988 stop:17419 length:432 start_codon:yes stop_codon:yes gene_type:complete